MCNSKNNEVKLTKNIHIKTENIKLSSFLKFIGAIATGGEAKEIINSGKIFVNGEPCFCRGKKINIGDVVCVGDILYEVRDCENS